uniref:Ankyrin repeat, SAM and basic leucine zipper domain-containing protein 1 n=1 Tax=Caligus rogercresseyi TaxID=217165 RepID=C1BNG7_CALRO|nr:Ankyrin repeat, SAM and basic leucine zipper domain-containing protein 1 [Caligus rogercresseyi]
MARPAGFSDSEDDFDDFIVSNEEYLGERHSPENPKEKDIFEDLQVPSFSGELTADGFKRDLYDGNLEGVRAYVKLQEPEIRSPLVTSSSNWKDLSPLEITASYGHASLLAYLLEISSAESPEDGPCPLMAIASSSANKNDLLACSKIILQQGDDVNRIDATSGMSPLMMAAKFGFVEFVELLHKQGSEVDNRDYNKWTALCHAANAGHGDVVRYLLVQGQASLSVVTSEGFEPSDLAERKGHRHVLEIMDAFSEVRSVFRGACKGPEGAPDISMILRGFGLSTDEMEAFFREGVTDLATLISLTERDISDRIGINRIGVVKSISAFIKDLHRKEWKRSCLPKVQIYDPSKGLKFSCPESISVMGNVRKQLLYLRSTIIYLQRGIDQNPEVLNIGKDVGNVGDLYNTCRASVSDSEGLLRDIVSFRRTLKPYLGQEDFLPVDEIKDIKRGRRPMIWAISPGNNRHYVRNKELPLGASYYLFILL